MLGLPFDGCKV
jgi:hypothetical protein